MQVASCALYCACVGGFLPPHALWRPCPVCPVCVGGGEESDLYITTDEEDYRDLLPTPATSPAATTATATAQQGTGPHTGSSCGDGGWVDRLMPHPLPLVGRPACSS
jgi:hypothetical protein